MRERNPNRKVQERYAGLTTAQGKFNSVIRMNEDFLELPLKVKKPTVWAIWCDLFHKLVPDEFIGRAYNVMYKAKQHQFMLLTKRPERMHEWHTKSAYLANEPYPNLWIGTTAENQEMAEKRIPELLQIPAAVRFVSVEPTLGPLDLRYIDHKQIVGIDALTGDHGVLWPFQGRSENKIDWVICGGESGRNARPMHPDWARSLRDQCQTAGVPFFFKQWGEWAPVVKGTDYLCDAKFKMLHNDGTEIQVFETYDPAIGDTVTRHIGKKLAGRILDGRVWDEFPEGR